MGMFKVQSLVFEKSKEIQSIKTVKYIISKHGLSPVLLHIRTQKVSYSQQVFQIVKYLNVDKVQFIKIKQKIVKVPSELQYDKPCKNSDLTS